MDGSLFKISETFVGRADAIEKYLWEMEDDKQSVLESTIGKEYTPHYIFMNNRVAELGKNLGSIKNLLMLLYAAIAIVWMISIVTTFGLPAAF